MRRRYGGFTLIELLVVIAIIAILAAMLFPVFARARESARKIQCLSNVKNIAMAIQMYVNDWENFFPLAHDKFADQYFKGVGGCEDCDSNPCNHVRQANPYLREAVILEEYVRNRDVWRCPSALLQSGARSILSVGRNGYWVNNFIDNGDWKSMPWEEAPRPCSFCWPSAWGGAVTDTFAQKRHANDDRPESGGADTGVFVQGVMTNDNMHWQKVSAVTDAAHYITCGDGGANPSYFWNARQLGWPDLCGGSAPCGLPDCPDACTADWANCSWSRECGLDADAKIKFYTDPNFRKNYARHLGGSNVGFLDGHAQWFPSETIIYQNCPWPNSIFEGLPVGCCWYPTPEPCQ